jgi:hypothetical protein
MSNPQGARFSNTRSSDVGNRHPTPSRAPVRALETDIDASHGCLVAALSKNGFLSLPPVEQRQLIRAVEALIPGGGGPPAESGDTGGGETGEGTPTSESTSDPDFCLPTI